MSFIEARPPKARVTPEPDSTGVWISVLDPQGREVFHEALPDPDTHGETGDEYAVRRVAGSRRPQIASLEAPWPGEGSQIAVHVRRAEPAARGRRASRPSEIARLPLSPAAVRRTARGPLRANFPVSVDEGWGRDNPHALNLVFLPEAFLAGRMAGFHDQVDKVKALLEQLEPYRSFKPALRICRIEIPSETDVIGEAAGRTFFRGRFAGAPGVGARVIQVDQEIAARTIAEHFPGRSARAMVVANTLTYGGSGGAAAVFSRHPDWGAHIGVHELGHAHFRLADEYIEAGQAETLKPVENNVSAHFDRPRLKWAHLVAAGTPLPTWRQGEAVPADVTRIGAFEGGKYQPTGVWRPAFDCKMNHVNFPEFCAVCRAEIEAKLREKMP